MRDTKEYTIFDGVTPVAVTSSTDATPIVVTATAHGFSTNDLVLIYGHTTNIAANGLYRVTKITDNTFSLQDKDTGDDIAGTGGGAGSGGIVVAAPKIPLIEDFRNAILSVFTSGTSTLTLKVAGSIGKVNGDCPNFGATVSESNPYDFIQIADLEDGSSLDGDTGIALVGADAQRQFEVNINALKYLTVFPAAWTQGQFTAKLKLFSNQ